MNLIGILLKRKSITAITGRFRNRIPSFPIISFGKFLLEHTISSLSLSGHFLSEHTISSLSLSGNFLSEHTISSLSLAGNFLSEHTFSSLLEDTIPFFDLG